MILELPNRETLEDGRIKITDSFEELLKLKEKYGDKFEIEPIDTDYNNCVMDYKDKASHWGYSAYPFLKSNAYIDGHTIYSSGDYDDFIFIIPEEFRNTLKPGKYIKDKWEKATPSLADYVKNVDTNEYYVLQEMGGGGDIEYSFIEFLINLENALNGIDDFINHHKYAKSFEMLLPLCTKRIGYLKNDK